MLIQIMRRTLGAFVLGCVGVMAMNAQGELPARYLPLDYIQATGEQWIHTEFAPLCTDRIELKMMLTPGTRAKTQALYCARSSGTSRTITGFSMGNGAFRFDRNSTQRTSSATPEEETEYTISVDYGACTASVNGEKVADLGGGDFPAGSPMTLFVSHPGTYTFAETAVNNWAYYRLYWFRVYDCAGNLKREFLPVLDLEAGEDSPQKCGLYETQTGTYFSTRKTTPFVPGLTFTPVTLTEDADWRAMGAAAVRGKAIDLNGHKLFVAGLNGPGSVTDSSTGAPGELHVDTAVAVTNVFVTLSGNLSLVKEGTGVFAARKTGQSYTGATIFAGGGLSIPNTCAGEAEAEIRVCAGQRLDLEGNFDFTQKMFVLEGGSTLTSSATPPSAADKMMVSNICLVADAAFDIGSSTYGMIAGGYSPAALDLGGHTLRLATSGAGTFYFANTTASAGTIDQYGIVEFYNTPSSFVNATLVANGQLRVNANCAPVSLGDYVVNATAPDLQIDSYPGILHVFGTFRPNTDFFRGCELQDGATLDLSGRTGIFSLRGAQTATNEVLKTVAFAPNATITVKVAGRTPALGEKLIAWAGAKPEGVAFAFDASAGGVSPVVSETGLFFGCAENSAFVDVAEWTGDADDDDFANAANWACKNPLGESVPGGVPGVLSTVRLSGSVAFQVPASAPVACEALDFGNARLTANCDWRGLAAGRFLGTLDLCGHTLRLATLTGSGCITDTAFDLTVDDPSRVACSSELFGGKAENLFSNNFSREYQSDKHRVIMVTSKLPLVVDYDFGEPTLIDSYGLAFGRAYWQTRAPRVWTYQGSNDKQAWVTLDERTNETGWSTHDYRRYTFPNETAYRYYRISISADQVATDGYMEFVQLEYGRADSLRGELRLDVPEGVTVTNVHMHVAGNLKFVKEGAGTYVAACERQTYCLGTEILEGRILYGTAIDTLGLGTVRIASGAVLDQNGFYPSLDHLVSVYNYELAGRLDQRLEDPGLATDAMTRPFACVTLTDDATIGGCNFCFEPNFKRDFGVMDLNGHTLTLDFGDYVHVNSFTLDNGRVVLPNGRLVIGETTSWTNVDFEVGADAVLKLKRSLHVKDFIYCGTVWQLGENSGVYVYVNGVFRPTSLHPALVLAPGATLDLSGETGVWSAKGASPVGSSTGLASFATSGHTLFNADDREGTITVDIHGRSPVVGEKLIEWAERPGANTRFAFDAETAARGVEPVVTEFGLFYGGDAASTVVTKATWTGYAGDGNVANPANWDCWNALGLLVEDGVPGAEAAVVVSGNLNLQVPAGSTFAPGKIEVKGGVLLSDCDWTGLDTSNLSGDIDLNGHKLSVSKLGGTARIFDVAGYDYLSYLKATGTQWINTTFVPACDDRIETSMNFNSLDKNQALWCARGGQNDHTFTGFMLSKRFRFDHNSGTGTTLGPTVVTGHDYTIIANGSSLEVTIDGTTYSSKMPSGTFTVGGPIALFSSYSSGVNNNHGNYARYQLYYLRVYAADGTLKRNFVPARRRIDGLLGVVDRVTGGFYSNSGTGEFEAGSVVQEGEDVVQPGELHVVVPAGETVQNSTVSFDGSMKVVKEGAGTFIAAKASQAYWGGTVVKGGTLTAPGAASVSYYGTTGLGAVIQIDEGGVLDNRGNYDYSNYNLVLNGGELANTGSGMTRDAPGFGYLDLCTNAVVRLASETVFKPAIVATTNHLNGHVLKMELAGTTRVNLSGTFENGTIELGPGGYVQSRNPSDFSTCDLILKGTAVYLGYDMTVRDYYTETSENPNLGVANLIVKGRFTPVSESWYGCVLQSGATLDLTRQEGTWPVSCEKTYGRATVTFAEGATIFVDLKGRTFRSGDLAVAWNVKPTMVTFLPTDGTRREGFRLVPETDGLHVYRGLAIIVR